MAHVPREAIVLLPPEANSRLKVFAYIGFEALQAANPGLELFVFAWKADPENPFCVVFGVPQEKIQDKGWPLIVDPAKRWVMARPIPDEELRSTDSR